MIEISSSKNPIIKEIKALTKKKDRWESKLFIMEGIKIIEEAIENSVELKYIIYSDKLFSVRDGTDFYNKIENMKGLIHVSDNIFDEISGTENSQGVIAMGVFRVKSLQDISDSKDQFLLFLDELQDPGNMGTIIRTADAFNISGIIIGEGCVDPYNPKVVRATMGSLFRMPLYFIQDNMDTILKLKNREYEVYATSLEGSSPNYSIDYKGKFLIIIGNEARGVNQKLINIADELIKIPILGHAESLNAGVAASIIMYEVMRQQAKNLEF
jgi:TrmH family RNA methyltransferase